MSKFKIGDEVFNRQNPNKKGLVHTIYSMTGKSLYLIEFLESEIKDYQKYDENELLPWPGKEINIKKLTKIIDSE